MNCLHLVLFNLLGVQKLTWISLKGVSEEGLLKDKFARFGGQFSLIKVLGMSGEKLLAKRPFLQAKAALF